MIHFKNRTDAAKQLAKKLEKYKNNADAIVLGLPRGGVPMAAIIAQLLHLPFDIIVTRKIGDPHSPELALGALTQEGTILLNEELITDLGVKKEDLHDTIEEEKAELNRRLQLYRGNKPPVNLQDKIVILVDDGIATGFTMRAAIASVKLMKAKKIIVATPIVPSFLVSEIKRMVNEYIYLDAPALFWGINLFYDEFPQISDKEVIELLKS